MHLEKWWKICTFFLDLGNTAVYGNLLNYDQKIRFGRFIFYPSLGKEYAMSETLFGHAPKEGEIFKIIHLYGKTFEIRYGFYEECDRHTMFAEPMEIYPDFLKEPQFTDEGIPFATAIQTPCEHFSGRRDDNSTCEDCACYRSGEELLGICTNPNRKSPLTKDHTELETRGISK